METTDLSLEQTLKNNIRKFRKSIGLSQDEFAERIGITRTSYRALEKGKTRILNDKVEKISQTFGIPAQELVLGRKAVEATDPMLRDEIISRDERLAAVKADYESRMAEKQNIINQLNQIINSQTNMMEMLNRQLDKNE